MVESYYWYDITNNIIFIASWGYRQLLKHSSVLVSPGQTLSGETNKSSAAFPKTGTMDIGHEVTCEEREDRRTCLYIIRYGIVRNIYIYCILLLLLLLFEPLYHICVCWIVAKYVLCLSNSHTAFSHVLSSALRRALSSNSRKNTHIYENMCVTKNWEKNIIIYR